MLPDHHVVFGSTEDEDDPIAFDSTSDSSSDIDDQSVIDTPEFSPISDISDSEISNMEMSSVTETEVSEDSTGELHCEINADPIEIDVPVATS